MKVLNGGKPVPDDWEAESAYLPNPPGFWTYGGVLVGIGISVVVYGLIGLAVWWLT